MINKKIYIKIFGAIVVALIFTQSLSTSVFIANTPQINTYFLSDTIQLAQNFMKNISNKSQTTAQKSDPKKQSESIEKFSNLPSSALNKMAPGVYAKEDIDNDVVYIRVDKDAEWDEQIVMVDGVEKKIRFPKGTLQQ